MNWVRHEISRNLDDPEFARPYVEDALRKRIAHQIRALREAKGWLQSELGEHMGKPQANISRIEDPEYGKWSLQTLFDVAHAFGLAPFWDFITYDDFMRRTEDLSAARLAAALLEQAAPRRARMDHARAATTDRRPSTESVHLDILLGAAQRPTRDDALDIRPNLAWLGGPPPSNEGRGRLGLFKQLHPIPKGGLGDDQAGQRASVGGLQ